MNQHHHCPMCDTDGKQITGQGEVSYACPNTDCRVYTFAEYYG
jgi:hypothetical protein